MSFRSTTESTLVFVSLTWMGMLLGVSFLATPIKFQVASLELAVALEVGRVTFTAFSRIEWGLAALLVVVSFAGRRSSVEIGLAVCVIVILALQALWLLPVLDARVDAAISGRPLSPSIHHTLYAVAEACKAVALAVLAIIALSRRSAHVRTRPGAPS